MLPNDQRFGVVIGRVLQAGVLVAATLVAVGGVMMLRQAGSAPVIWTPFTPATLTSIRSVTEGLGALTPASIVMLGILVLIATPIARVVFTLAAFVAARDRLYSALSAVVLAILLIGLLA